VATISRLLKIIGLFGRISSLFKGSFAKETYHFKEPTNRSHPIPASLTAASRLAVGAAHAFLPLPGRKFSKVSFNSFLQYIL